MAATDTGLVFAQNMMYTHTVTVYNSSGKLVKTIPDTVEMSKFGIQGHPGITHGAPVEAAVTPDAKYVYVSNYSMYGSGFGPEGNDDCTPASAEAAGDTDSYVYRISTSSLSIDQVIKVGLVPKFLAVTPNGKYVLVANWCSFDLSVVNVAQGKRDRAAADGRLPAGLAVSPELEDGLRGGHGLRRRHQGRPDDAQAGRAASSSATNPRHLVISPDGRYLYASLNGTGRGRQDQARRREGGRHRSTPASRPVRWRSPPTAARCTSSTTTPTRSPSCGRRT